MGYYIRIFTPSQKDVPLAEIQSYLNERGLTTEFTLEEGTPEAWVQFSLSHSDGLCIASIERNPVTPGSLGSGKLHEFIVSIEHDKPESAAQWLREYLPKVKTIYALQLLAGTHERNGWDAVHAVRESLSGAVGGIVQADGEGFSNEYGNHILWHFSERAKGRWWLAVLKNGEWVPFQMELSNRKQRDAFLRGEVPEGVVFPPAEDG